MLYPFMGAQLMRFSQIASGFLVVLAIFTVLVIIDNKNYSS